MINSSSIRHRQQGLSQATVRIAHGPNLPARQIHTSQDHVRPFLPALEQHSSSRVSLEFGEAEFRAAYNSPQPLPTKKLPFAAKATPTKSPTTLAALYDEADDSGSELSEGAFDSDVELSDSLDAREDVGAQAGAGP